MPRRRATKINVRATPKVSNHTDPDELSEKERKERIEMFLSDFDEKVANQLKSIQDEKKRMLQIVYRRLHLQIIQVPSEVKNLTIREFIAAGGTLESVSEKLKPADDTKESVIFTSNRKYCETITEEQSEFTVPKATTGRKKKYGTRSNAPKRQDPPSTVKSNFRTPLTRQAAAGWDTPMITPKFDPRLPLQSCNIRDPKPGERLVSLQGSPVAVSTKKGPTIKLRDNHLTMDLDLTENLTLDDIDLDLNEDYIKKVMRIFSQISNKLTKH